MNLTMKKIAAGLFLAGFATVASAVPVTSVTFTSGTLVTFTSGTLAMENYTLIQPFTYIGPNANLVGGYKGDPLAMLMQLTPYCQFIKPTIPTQT